MVPGRAATSGGRIWMRMKTMTSKSESASARQERLAAELRANLQRRKAQARARRAGDADRRDEGIAAADRTTDADDNGEPAGDS